MSSTSRTSRLVRWSERSIAASEGSTPPGKMYVWIQLAPRRCGSYATSGNAMVCRLNRPPGASARSQASKNVAKYSAPTASSISIETMASYVPLMSR